MNKINEAAKEAITGLMLSRTRAIQFVMKNERCTRRDAEQAVNVVLGQKGVLCED